MTAFRVDPEPGNRLKVLRLAKGWTQSQLAGDRYTKAYISALENGLIRFSVAAGQYLAERLGVTITDLLDGDRTAALRAAVEALPGQSLGDYSNHDWISREDVLDLLGGSQ